MKRRNKRLARWWIGVRIGSRGYVIYLNGRTDRWRETLPLWGAAVGKDL